MFLLLFLIFISQNLYTNNKKLSNIDEIKKYLIKKYNLNDINKLITFNQKLQWTKIYNISPLRTLLVDKYLVRDWVKKKLEKNI